jgi:hypothetical protein
MSEISPMTDRILVERIREAPPIVPVGWKSNWPDKIEGGELEHWLPHRDIALCLDSIVYFPDSEIIFGYWKPDVRYFEGHFGILPGHWVSESAHLTGAVLGQMVHKDLYDTVPLLGANNSLPENPVIFGMTLIHGISVLSRDGKKLSFLSRTTSSTGKIVSTETFSGTSVSKKLFAKMLTRMAV